MVTTNSLFVVQKKRLKVSTSFFYGLCYKLEQRYYDSSVPPARERNSIFHTLPYDLWPCMELIKNSVPKAHYFVFIVNYFYFNCSKLLPR